MKARIDHLELMEQSRQLCNQIGELSKVSKNLLYKSKSLRHIGRFLVTQDYTFPKPVKVCSCGKKYHAIRWADLQLIGYDTVGHMDAELRQCTCGSTLTIIIERRKSHDT